MCPACAKAARLGRPLHPCCRRPGPHPHPHPRVNPPGPKGGPGVGPRPARVGLIAVAIPRGQEDLYRAGVARDEEPGTYSDPAFFQDGSPYMLGQLMSHVGAFDLSAGHYIPEAGCCAKGLEVGAAEGQHEDFGAALGRGFKNLGKGISNIFTGKRWGEGQEKASVGAIVSAQQAATSVVQWANRNVPHTSVQPYNTTGSDGYLTFRPKSKADFAALAATAKNLAGDNTVTVYPTSYKPGYRKDYVIEIKEHWSRRPGARDPSIYQMRAGEDLSGGFAYPGIGSVEGFAYPGIESVRGFSPGVGSTYGVDGLDESGSMAEVSGWGGATILPKTFGAGSRQVPFGEGGAYQIPYEFDENVTVGGGSYGGETMLPRRGFARGSQQIGLGEGYRVPYGFDADVPVVGGGSYGGETMLPRRGFARGSQQIGLGEGYRVPYGFDADVPVVGGGSYGGLVVLPRQGFARGSKQIGLGEGGDYQIPYEFDENVTVGAVKVRNPALRARMILKTWARNNGVKWDSHHDSTSTEADPYPVGLYLRTPDQHAEMVEAALITKEGVEKKYKTPIGLTYDKIQGKVFKPGIYEFIFFNPQSASQVGALAPGARPERLRRMANRLRRWAQNQKMNVGNENLIAIDTTNPSRDSQIYGVYLYMPSANDRIQVTQKAKTFTPTGTFFKLAPSQKMGPGWYIASFANDPGLEIVGTLWLPTQNRKCRCDYHGGSYDHAGALESAVGEIFRTKTPAEKTTTIQADIDKLAGKINSLYERLDALRTQSEEELKADTVIRQGVHLVSPQAAKLVQNLTGSGRDESGALPTRDSRPVWQHARIPGQAPGQGPRPGGRPPFYGHGQQGHQGQWAQRPPQPWRPGQQGPQGQQGQQPYYRPVYPPQPQNSMSLYGPPQPAPQAVQPVAPNVVYLAPQAPAPAPMPAVSYAPPPVSYAAPAPGYQDPTMYAQYAAPSLASSLPVGTYPAAVGHVSLEDAEIPGMGY